MNSPDERPSLWDVRSCLLSSMDFAEDLSRNRPEHAPAVDAFLQDIRGIKNEVMRSLKKDLPPSSLPDIVNGLTGARAMVSIIAERHPEQSASLTRFVERLSQAQDKLVQSIRPHNT